MINRVLIRLKIVQIVYAYYQNGGKNLDTAEKELFFSLSKAYDLYNYLLLLMVEVTKQANKRLNAAKNKLVPTKEELFPNTKFVENRFIAQLEVNKQLLEFSNNQKKTWENEADFVKTLCDKILESDIYKEYMASETSSYEEDRELWRKLYKNIIFNNIELDQVLEDQSLYWNDDKEIVDTFVLKTIKRFDEKNGAKQELLPEFKDEEDQDFARRLFRRTILNADYYRHLISENTKNWDLDRVAFMDVVIMQIALAEILSFPNVRQVNAGIRNGLHYGLQHILGEHHEVGDGLADDGIQRDEDGERNKRPEAAGHGVDALFAVELLHLLIELLGVAFMAALKLLKLGLDTGLAHHALLALGHERGKDKVDDQCEEDDGDSVVASKLIELDHQPCKRFSDYRPHSNSLNVCR